MKNWLIIFLVAAVVIAGAFLPEALLNRSPLPELNLSQQELAISAQSSSDYTHRMDALGEYYFGEGLNLLSTYISQVTPEEGDTEAIEPFLTEFRKLVSDGVMPDAVGQLLDENTDYRIRYYYMFDSQSVSGFRYAELTAAASTGGFSCAWIWIAGNWCGWTTAAASCSPMGRCRPRPAGMTYCAPSAPIWVCPARR